MAGGSEGPTGGKVWDRETFDENEEEDGDNLTDTTDREGPRRVTTTTDRSARMAKRLTSYLSGNIKKSWGRPGSTR